MWFRFVVFLRFDYTIITIPNHFRLYPSNYWNRGNRFLHFLALFFDRKVGAQHPR